MAQTSAIEWTDATWNPVTGCSKVSPGCAHCYAETVTARFAGSPGWISEHRPWTPENAEHNVRLHPERLEQPLRWRKPRMVFVNSMSDLFHENIPYEFQRECFNVMRRCDGGVIAATGKRDPRHVFQILTKRPEQALELWRSRKLGFDTWPDHIWLGVSIENARYTWRAAVLREIPAAVRFISAEPLLGSLFPERCAVTAFPLDGGSYVCGRVKGHTGLHASRYELGAEWEDGDGKKLWSNVEDTHWARPLDLTGIDWLIVGGEGGRDARPMHPEWARELRDAALGECIACETCVPFGCTHENRPAFFFKQWGEWAPESRAPAYRYVQERRARELRDVGGQVMARIGKKAAGRLLDGRTWDEMPAARQTVAA